jgi:hypothetical protein
MGFQANVLRVMIASPGDVSEEKRIVTDEIYRWNNAHSFSRKLLLQPVKWDTHSTPQLGKPPQDVINEQILEDADILIGIFGTRVGTPTEMYISGTVEEIKKHVGAGKTAKVYFSDVPVAPSQIDSQQYAALQAFKEECKTGGLYATYKDLDSFKDAIQQHLAIELNLPRYLWLTEPTLQPQRSETPLSADAKRALIAAAAVDGRITTIQTHAGDIVHAGKENLSGGSVRTGALWKEAFQELASRMYIEPMGSKPGNYRVTAAGFRAADKIIEEEQEKKQLEIELTINGSPESQKIDIKSNKVIHLRQLELLTSSEACIAHEDLDVEGTAASVPIDHDKVVKLFNAPRADRNFNDHSGPAILRLTYVLATLTKSIDLPVLLQPVFVHSGNGSTQYISLTGQKKFYL